MYRRSISWIVLCVLIQHIVGAMLLHLSSNQREINKSLKMISFCFDCPNPEDEGSVAFGLIAKHSVQEYSLTGEMAYTVPNFAELPKILNGNQLNKRIAFVERGVNGLVEKVVKISKTGAVAIIIADDGRCNADYTFCGNRAGSVSEGGFAPFDDISQWKGITVPVIMINLETAERFRKLMVMKRIKIPKLAELQNMTILRSDDSNEEDL